MKTGNKTVIGIIGIIALMIGLNNSVSAAGTLTPVGSGLQPAKIEDHHLSLTINNGFARTEVVQTFSNPNTQTVEAIYSFPLPVSASLSEVSISIGEKVINGEVISKEKAEKIYKEEKDKGNDAGLAEKNKYKDFKFKIANITPNGRAVIKFVYYQPLNIDSGIGRYVYPLEEGGTDDAAENFWTRNSTVEGDFTANIEIKSAVPLDAVRSPSYTPLKEEKLGEGHYKLSYKIPQFKLEKDFIVYYRLHENLPGRIEVIPYRADENSPGTFMMVVTPGLDLQPLQQGADYIFVLDTSGSMSAKLHSLCNGVSQALGKMTPHDRFRIVLFNTDSQDLTRGWVDADEQNVKKWIANVDNLKSSGSTNLYAGIKMALGDLDADRVTSVILVTDGVTNTGIVAPEKFHKLMKQYDVRIFGFLMGNSGNWPLMRVICDASGGFYAGVSNSDDIIGQILKAKSKITHECLHDATLKISGVKVYDTTDENFGKIYRGEQLVFFGKYKEGGKAKVVLKATLSGQDKVYSTEFEFPAIDTDNPELERLWAINKIEMFEDMTNSGLMKEAESKTAIRDIGIEYQIVTDETSMIVLSDEDFVHHNIERRNQARTAIEHQSQAIRNNAPIKNYRVDNKKRAFNFNAPRLGGGAVDPISLLIFALTGGLALSGIRKKKQ